MIKIWNSKTMEIVASARIKCGYLTSLMNFEKGFIVGTGSGELIKFSDKLQRQWTKKIHHDCVTDIFETDRQIISVGSDGRVCFISRENLSVKRQLDLGVPLSKITQIGNEIFVAGNPSFKIDLDSYEVKKQRRSFQFLELDEKICSCSDEKGLEILGLEELNENIPCHFMLPFHGKLVVIAEEMIGMIDFQKSFTNDHHLSYRFYKTVQLKKGYGIRTGLAFDDFIVLAG